MVVITCICDSDYTRVLKGRDLLEASEPCTIVCMLKKTRIQAPFEVVLRAGNDSAEFRGAIVSVTSVFEPGGYNSS